ncbi:MAG: hypothetical protein E7255_14865 [Lachnospiraceae bacterium]|nr:hypothetical protein [Lachnospiraceae bacterium]
MQKPYKNIIPVAFIGIIWLVLAVFCWIKPSDEISKSERRKLEQLPKLTSDTLLSGEFMKDFDHYTQDQFPRRTVFRKLKAYTRFYLFAQKDNNDIYLENGYAAKLEYPLNESSILSAADKFRYLYEKYMKEQNLKVYLSVIPDKGYYLAAPNGYPSMDYEKLFKIMKEHTKFAEYIDISDVLRLEDYYNTDIHWRQEKLLPVVEKLGAAMHSLKELSLRYDVIEAENPFYGVYYGQSALPLEPEKLYYLTNDTIRDCTVDNVETKQMTPVYDMEKMNGRDPYEGYLSGAAPLLFIDNPHAANKKELIVFRDSFGSSLIPLLLEGYSKVTLVDIRYIASDYLENFITFDNQEVLFLYSTPVLNSSMVLK